MEKNKDQNPTNPVQAQSEEKPKRRYSKTWEAVLKYQGQGNLIVNDPTFLL